MKIPNRCSKVFFVDRFRRFNIDFFFKGKVTSFILIGTVGKEIFEIEFLLPIDVIYNMIL